MAEGLLDLLDAERDLLLAGDLAGLEALTPRKEAALAALDDGGPLDRVTARLARNQALLAAAIEGVRDAQRRRAAMAEARTRLSSYDASGARPEVAAAPKVERRA